MASVLGGAGAQGPPHEPHEWTGDLVCFSGNALAVQEGQKALQWCHRAKKINCETKIGCFYLE